MMEAAQKTQPRADEGIAAGEGLLPAVRALSRARGEPDWLARSREEAAALYDASEMPDRVSHLWRYTDPETFLPEGIQPPPSPRAVPVDWPTELDDALRSGAVAGAVLAEGGALEARLDPGLSRAGVFIGDPRERPDVVRSLLGTVVPASMGKFEALAAALWSTGILVHVPKGVEVAKPIHLWTRTGGALEIRRLLIVAGEGSEVTVIDERVSRPGTAGLAFDAVEAFAGQGSRLRHVAVQRLDRKAVLHLTGRARADRDAKVLSVIASLGGASTKADLGTFLEGRGAEVELVGFLFGQDRQHFDHHTVHDHRAPDTRSDLDFKVVLKDRSRSAYTGLIRIDPAAPRCEAYQENRNLLLDAGSRADSIPELEILTDEVVCTHGATVGSLDPEHLFYLMSRGIPAPEARRMIVGGFIEPTLARLDGGLRERLQAYVDAGLAGL